MWALFREGVQMSAQYDTKKKLIKGIMLYHPDKYSNPNGIFMLNKLYEIKQIEELAPEFVPY